jgi:hypothetical protein
LDILICDLDILAFKVRHFFGELPCIVDRAWRQIIRLKDAVRNGYTVIVFTERGGLVYDTRSVGVCDVRIREYSEGAVFILDRT